MAPGADFSPHTGRCGGRSCRLDRTSGRGETRSETCGVAVRGRSARGRHGVAVSYDGDWRRGDGHVPPGRRHVLFAPHPMGGRLRDYLFESVRSAPGPRAVNRDASHSSAGTCAARRIRWARAPDGGCPSRAFCGPPDRSRSAAATCDDFEKSDEISGDDFLNRGSNGEAARAEFS